MSIKKKAFHLNGLLKRFLCTTQERSIVTLQNLKLDGKDLIHSQNTFKSHSLQEKSLRRLLSSNIDKKYTSSQCILDVFDYAFCFLWLFATVDVRPRIHRCMVYVKIRTTEASLVPDKVGQRWASSMSFLPSNKFKNCPFPGCSLAHHPGGTIYICIAYASCTPGVVQYTSWAAVHSSPDSCRHLRREIQILELNNNN